MGSLKYTYDYTNGYRDPQTGQIIPRATATTVLSPEQQRMLDQQNQLGTSLNDFAIRGLGKVDESFRAGIDQSQLPGLRTGPNAPQFQTSIPNAGGIQRDFLTPELQGGRFNLRDNVNPTGFQSNYDFSAVGAMPSSNDFAAQRDKITDAMMQRMQPLLDRQRDAMNTRLANQGVTAGSEAWRWDQDTFNRAENDQRIAALLAGNQEQQNLFNNAMNIRGQGVNEAIAQGNFYNTAQSNTFNQGLANANLANMAQQTEFGQNLARQQNQFTQNLAAMDARNAAQNQQFAQNQVGMQAGNQALEAQFRSGLASDQFANQARQQAIQEQTFFQDRPLSILNSLRTGNAPTMPQFGNVTAGANIGAAPVYNATADQYNAALQQWQARAGMFSDLLSGIGSLGSAAITKFSDRRLKRNIRLLSRLADGLGVYAYNYLWSSKPETGVMADEVAKLRPQALGPTIGGFATVNYGAL